MKVAFWDPKAQEKDLRALLGPAADRVLEEVREHRTDAAREKRWTTFWALADPLPAL